ncbi:hypothetical protein Tco_0069344, partial [Tanacetum coccineum]
SDPLPDVRGAFTTLSRDESHRGSQSSSTSKTGASQHMTYTVLNMFNVVEVSKLNMTVGHPNGTKAVVTHVGSLRLMDQIVIHDVLIMPGYDVILLSVHKLCKDNKFRVMFDENVCVIQDSIQRTQVGTGNESNGLYFLNTGKNLSIIILKFVVI